MFNTLGSQVINENVFGMDNDKFRNWKRTKYTR
jgi:hypothetical protein